MGMFGQIVLIVGRSRHSSTWRRETSLAASSNKLCANLKRPCTNEPSTNYSVVQVAGAVD